MSVRYGISLVLQPSFTVGVHHARQTICSQYAAWAAEMHMVHLPLVDYFQCEDDAAPSVDAGLDELAAQFRRDHPDVYLCRQGVVSEEENGGSIYLEFTDAGEQRPTVTELRTSIIEVLNRRQPIPQQDNPALRIALMQRSNLPPAVFQSAVTFAAGAFDGSELPQCATLGQLVLIRFESDAAGDDWNQGGWAADLRWQVINSHPLRPQA